MYVHSVKLVNYKSIGNYNESEVIVEPKITALIGKNESGKSNVLDGMGKINFLSKNNDAFLTQNINRKCDSKEENKYVIVLKSTSEEKEKHLCEDTIVEISKNSYSATGGICKYYNREAYLDVDGVAEYLQELGNNPLQLSDSELVNYKIYIDELKKQDNLDIPKVINALDFIAKRTKKISVIEEQKKLENLVITAKNCFKIITDVFPVFFYRNEDKHLKETYKLEEVEKEIRNVNENPRSLLYDFVKLLDVSEDDFILAVKSGTDSIQISRRKKILRTVSEKIDKKFNEFYGTEEIFLELDFNSNAVSFLVRSNDGESLKFSERSNGLRWYMELFIDALSHNVSNKNTIYLLDEPGISLHVNAQKELLHMFSNLTDKGNQVVYTTHSPYMLNVNDGAITSIRAVVKNKEGYTHIYKTAYDARISEESQHDTLTPIIEAIGMNLQETFGPAKNKLNIVTEGMSDYIYISMMIKKLNVNTEEIVLIPSVGVTNCMSICNILYGWKCNYKALFDYDKEGVEKGGEYMRKEMFYELGKQYEYIKDVSQTEIDNQTYKQERYLIEDLVTREVIENFCNLNNIAKKSGKSLIAKLMSQAVDKKEFDISEICIENFRGLFKRIGIL